MDFYATFTEVWVSGRVVDEFREFSLAHFRGMITKDENQGVDWLDLPDLLGPTMEEND